MSAEQWAGIQRGNEAYAGSPSFGRFREAVSGLFPFRHILPTHQGRAAEKILFTVTGGPGRVIPNNTHFDTTRANIEFTGAQAVDLPIPEGLQPALRHPFKGNMDVAALHELLAGRAAAVPLVMLTVTNNSGGGQPVSLANIRAVREVCDRYGKPLFLDACRFAENAWFIKTGEPGYAGVPVAGIVRDMAALADGMTMFRTWTRCATRARRWPAHYTRRGECGPARSGPSCSACGQTAPRPRPQWTWSVRLSPAAPTPKATSTT